MAYVGSSILLLIMCALHTRLVTYEDR